jgi:hypothetical protein
MSHQVQLRLTVPTAVWTRPGTPLSHRPADADAGTPRADMRGILSHPGNPIGPAIVHSPAEDSPAVPGRHDRTGLRGPAMVRWQDRFPRRERREAAAGNLCAPAYVPGHLGSDLPASLVTALDLRGTPQAPAVDLP